jgi:hypothetical protein
MSDNLSLERYFVQQHYIYSNLTTETPQHLTSVLYTVAMKQRRFFLLLLSAVCTVHFLCWEKLFLGTVGTMSTLLQ